ncbi:MAG: class I SAM-dependent methyltransferase [Proteobacteria bacterium]|jgi:SAM-dependent methyltransferase|nr:class I SAM-dependent methyltransferase [Pseudomonadota bacterium]
MPDLYTNGRYGALNPDWHEVDAKHKARAIAEMWTFCAVHPKVVLDVGCGTGSVLFMVKQLMDRAGYEHCQYEGWDIARDAISRARERESSRLTYVCGDFVTSERRADLILCVDTFEHVPDDVGFLEVLRGRADWFLFRIPLDLSGLDIIRPRRILGARRQWGHRHAYNRALALEVLSEAGFRVEKELYHRLPLPNHRLRGKATDGIRRLLFLGAPHQTVNWLGGWSLLVFASAA